MQAPDVDAIAAKLEKLLPELGRIRRVTRFDVAQPDAGVDYLYLEAHQAFRIVGLLELLRELRSGQR